VKVRGDRDQYAVAARLARKYHFKPYVLRVLHGFVIRNVNEDIVEQLRCDHDVESVEYDQPTSISKA